METIKPLTEIYCEQCKRFRREPCWNHASRIPDHCVIPYATASLPSTLYILDNRDCTGKRILAKGRIPLQTVFGPLVAPLSETFAWPFLYACTGESNRKLRYFQLGNDQFANWMKYVRFATKPNEENVGVYVRDNQVFFVTTREIEPHEELRLMYSTEYAELIGYETPYQWNNGLMVHSSRKISPDVLSVSDPDPPPKTPKKRVNSKKPRQSARCILSLSASTSMDISPPSPEFPFPYSAEKTFECSRIPNHSEVERAIIIHDDDADHSQAEEVPRKVRRKLTGYQAPVRIDRPVDSVISPSIDNASPVLLLVNGPVVNALPSTNVQTGNTNIQVTGTSATSSDSVDINPDEQVASPSSINFNGAPRDLTKCLLLVRTIPSEAVASSAALLSPTPVADPPSPSVMIVEDSPLDVLSSSSNDSAETPPKPGVRIRTVRPPAPFVLLTSRPLRPILPRGGDVPISQELHELCKQVNPDVTVKLPSCLPSSEECGESTSNSDENQLLVMLRNVDQDEEMEEASREEQIPKLPKRKPYQRQYQDCKLCGYRCNTMCDHMWIKHREYMEEHFKVQCETCGMKFSTESGLRSHTAWTHPLEVTEPNSDEIETAIQYMKSTGNFTYYCSECEKHFPSKPVLDLHEYQHRDDIPADNPERSCPSCTFIADNFSTLIEHTSQHAFALKDRKPCFLCGDYFIQVKLHIQAHHPEAVVQMSEDWEYECKECKIRFPREEQLALHNRKRHKVFRCLYCAKLGHTQREIREHAVEHVDDDGRYPCPSCDRTFPTHLKFRFHFEDSHNLTGISRCDMCQSVFRSAFRLAQHMECHQGNRKRRATGTRKRVRNMNYIRPTQRMKFEEFPYKCTECRLGFMKPLSLYKHNQHRHAPE